MFDIPTYGLKHLLKKHVFLLPLKHIFNTRLAYYPLGRVVELTCLTRGQEEEGSSWDRALSTSRFNQNPAGKFPETLRGQIMLSQTKFIYLTMQFIICDLLFSESL